MKASFIHGLLCILVPVGLLLIGCDRPAPPAKGLGPMNEFERAPQDTPPAAENNIPESPLGKKEEMPKPSDEAKQEVKKHAFLTGHTGHYVRYVGFSPDGKTLASGGDDKTVRLWEVATGKEAAVLRGHTDEVWYVAFLPDGKILAAGSTALDESGPEVKMWDVGKVLERPFTQHDEPDPSRETPIAKVKITRSVKADFIQTLPMTSKFSSTMVDLD